MERCRPPAIGIEFSAAFVEARLFASRKPNERSCFG